MLDELGMLGLGINGWIGILAPARTPDDVCAKLNAAVNQIVAQAGCGQAPARARL
jgi:tripartite-type tricarboxylate transporter receptor subunit TctC